LRRFQRETAPDILAAKSAAWNQRWLERQAASPKAQFQWPQVDKTPLNHLLIGTDEAPGPLKRQTEEHCSYCDQFPVSPPGTETIDHFKPKSLFPAEAYSWENLYFACNRCQLRGDTWDEKLLRPDAEDFEFARYFIWDYTSGALLPNPAATSLDQARAAFTIASFGLNELHPRCRMREQRRRASMLSAELADFAYRSFIE
jgi:uncharacterized protein (TIGR02646 family)